MALKPDRYEEDTDISFFCNTVAERGKIASLVTVGSGAAMDQSRAVVGFPANPSGAIPIGLLLNDVVNYDLTRQILNPHKDEVQIGSKVTLLKKGWVVTNLIDSTPTAGARAYLTGTGYVCHGGAGQPAVGNEWPIVGRFLSKKDENGYAKLEVLLPSPTLAPPLTTSSVEDTL